MLERVPQHAKALFRRGQARLALKARRPTTCSCHTRRGRFACADGVSCQHKEGLGNWQVAAEEAWAGMQGKPQMGMWVNDSVRVVKFLRS